ncbi:MAG: NB-ARC domain-containing protein [Terriglobia bacterium]|jgi:WD40 repeat protein
MRDTKMPSAHRAGTRLLGSIHGKYAFANRLMVPLPILSILFIHVQSLRDRLSAHMSKPGNARVFISYAWKDDQTFVERLYNDLQRLGYDPWMDKKNMPSRGRSLPKEVEEQIQICDRVLAVMGPAAITSEACQGERAFAFGVGKVVTAILRLGDYKMLPRELSKYFVPDFRAWRPYEAALDELVRVLHDPPVIPGRLFDVPAPPAHLQHRPDELRALRESVTAAELSETTVITSAGHVGLQGMGGVGKTVMAALTARDYTVRRQFQNGIIWLTFGGESNVLRQVQKALTALGDDGTKYSDLSLARMQLGRALEDKECLLILDDVRYAAETAPFRQAMNPRSRLLITTRILAVVDAIEARAHSLDLLTEKQSRELLASWCSAKPGDLPPEAGDLIHECGRLPLALAMICAMLHGKPTAYWKLVADLLRHADLAKIEADFPDYPYRNLLRAIQVSVEALDPTARERYLALAVLLEDMPIHPAIQQTLWGVDEGEALETAEKFVDLSLAQRDGPQREEETPSIRLHDLQLDYVRAQCSESDREALDTIRAAVRLSAHVIVRDPRQFASQMLGGLLSDHSPRIQKLMRLAAKYRATPWLKPKTASLTAPGGPLVRVLAGHSWWINGVAVTPDGKRAVSASDDETLKVWDLESGRELQTLAGHSDEVHEVAVTPDGKRAVSASSDKTLKVWDLESGKELQTLAGHTNVVNAVAMTPDGKRAVSASWDSTLKVWDLESGRELQTLAGHSDEVHGLAVTPDGKRAVSASEDKTLKVWDLESGRELQTLAGHNWGVHGVAVTPDGKRAVSASEDRTLRVWDIETGKGLQTLAGHNHRVHEVAVTPDGKRAVSASGDKTLKVWDLDRGKELQTLAGHSEGVSGVAVTPDGKCAVSASDDLTLRVWDLEGRKELQTLAGHSDRVTAVAVTPDGKRAVSASEDQTLKVWDLESGRELQTVAVHNWGVHGLAVTPDGKRAVSAPEDRTLRVWDLDSGKELQMLVGHSERVTAVAVTPDGRRAVSASRDRTLKLWDLSHGKVVATFTADAKLLACAVGPDGRVIIAGDESGRVHFLSLEE